MSEPPVIDLQAIDVLRQLNPGDDSFVRELVGIYLEDTPRRIAELDQSLGSGDRTRFTRAAHSIKGSSANLGVTVVRTIAESLEHRSGQEDLTKLTGLVAQLKNEFARAQLEFARLLPSP